MDNEGSTEWLAKAIANPDSRSLSNRSTERIVKAIVSLDSKSRGDSFSPKITSLMPYHFKKWYYQQERRSAQVLYQNCRTQAQFARTANAPLVQKMNIGVHLLDRKVRNATTHRGGGGVSLIQFVG